MRDRTDGVLRAERGTGKAKKGYDTGEHKREKRQREQDGRKAE
jgi:hypothetical protein